MLDQETLNELKSKLPHRHAPKVIAAYERLYKSRISRSTINRFFRGEMYSNELHSAVLDVAQMPQLLTQKTLEVLNA